MSNDPFEWKLLSSEYLFNDTWLRARKDTCLKPDGSIVTPYYVIEYPQWATGLAITKDNKAVLVKQYRHALGRTCIEIPGGCIDEVDDDNYQAIRRELLEETGYAFDKVEYLGYTSPNPSTNSNLMHMFLLTGGEKVQEQDLDANEQIEVMLVPMQDLLEMVQQNKFVQAMHVTTILYALQKLGLLKMGL